MLKAAKYCPQMIDTHRDIALDESQPGAVRVAAANLVLDRGLGKPRPAPEVTDGEPREELGRRMTQEEIEAVVERVKQLPETERDCT